jgi:protein-S-isoprenylcysteine O-methyltransferase Ste14
LIQLNPFTIAAIILFTYGSLLVLWLLTLPIARHFFSKHAQVLESQTGPAPAANRRTWWITAGTLLVFLANIATMGMFLLAAFRPGWEAFLAGVRVIHPAGVQAVGAIFFIGNGVWGLLVLVFNPGYTPFFLKKNHRILLATNGPYAVIRHPRYASEAALNVILFLFTGSWIPLLGILGWAAIRAQAIREEEFLQAADPGTYAGYIGRTGRFLPRWKFRKEA